MLPLLLRLLLPLLLSHVWPNELVIYYMLTHIIMRHTYIVVGFLIKNFENEIRQKRLFYFSNVCQSCTKTLKQAITSLAIWRSDKMPSRVDGDDSGFTIWIDVCSTNIHVYSLIYALFGTYTVNDIHIRIFHRNCRGQCEVTSNRHVTGRWVQFWHTLFNISALTSQITSSIMASLQALSLT